MLLSSPAAAQRCAEGAGLDSGAATVAQSAMPSIALPATAPTADHLSTNTDAPAASHLQSRISTSLTDVTQRVQPPFVAVGQRVSQPPIPGQLFPGHQFVGTDLQGDAPEDGPGRAGFRGPFSFLCALPPWVVRHFSFEITRTLLVKICRFYYAVCNIKKSRDFASTRRPLSVDSRVPRLN